MYSLKSSHNYQAKTGDVYISLLFPQIPSLLYASYWQGNKHHWFLGLCIIHLTPKVTNA